MDMQKKNKQLGKSTQSFLRMSEIKNDTVVLDDGTLRAILVVSSTNFDLKSQEEQEAIIFNYQRFLNSLDFTVQILMQSRKMEIGSYVDKLKKIAEKQTNELLRVQTVEYIEFVSRLIENASIMNKNFYVIVPLGKSITPGPTGFLTKIFGGGKTKETQERIENFEKAKQELDTRVLSVSSNLSSVGLKAVRLKTEEIIQLYYNSYNFESGPVIDPKSLAEIKITEPQS
jgi:hypothetical protein